jgi:hypothetical protein
LRIWRRLPAGWGLYGGEDSPDCLILPRRNLARNIPHDFGQLGGTDLVEEAIELDVLLNRRAVAKQLDVVVERRLEVHDGEAVVIEQRRDIGMMMIVKLPDNQLRRQGRRTAEVVRAFISNPRCFLYSYRLNLPIFSLRRRLWNRGLCESAGLAGL